MGQIIPSISSGNKELLFSETVCFNPVEGLTASIQTTDKSNNAEKVLHFNFVFKYEFNLPSKFDINFINDTNTFNIVLSNFGKPSPMSSEPIKINYFNTTIFIFLVANSLFDNTESKILSLSMSFFTEKLNA